MWAVDRVRRERLGRQPPGTNPKKGKKRRRAQTPNATSYTDATSRATRKNGEAGSASGGGVVKNDPPRLRFRWLARWRAPILLEETPALYMRCGKSPAQLDLKCAHPDFPPRKSPRWAKSNENGCRKKNKAVINAVPKSRRQGGGGRVRHPCLYPNQSVM